MGFSKEILIVDRYLRNGKAGSDQAVNDSTKSACCWHKQLSYRGMPAGICHTKVLDAGHWSREVAS